MIKNNIDYKKGINYTLQKEENTEVEYILYNFMIVIKMWNIQSLC